MSLENSEIPPDEDRHRLTDLHGSKNGTWLNWNRLDQKEPAPLSSGDVIGVGPTVLVYREG